MYLLTRLAHIIPDFHKRAIRIKQYFLNSLPEPPIHLWRGKVAQWTIH